MIDSPSSRKSVRVSEIVTGLLQRIGQVEPYLNAFITVMDESAREVAARIDEAREQGRKTGCLTGLVIAVKDNIDTAGVRTTAGSKFFIDHRAERDSEVVRRLRGAGAVILGKTILHEFAYGVTTKNAHFGACHNPWDLDKVPGGSSGGSGVAVAADLCIGALGTDTGGSIRIPAALNCVTGLRPTLGTVSVRGTFPVSVSYDTVGPMARNVEDVASMFAIMGGFDPEDPWSDERDLNDPRQHLGDGVDGLQIGVPQNYFFNDLDPGIEQAVGRGLEQLEQLGGRLVECEVPDPASANDAIMVVRETEAYLVHRERLETHREWFGDDLAQRIERGSLHTGSDFAKALAWTHHWRQAVRALFEEIDVIITPTVPITAPSITAADQPEIVAQLLRCTLAWSVAGGPALSVPCGFGSDGMPAAMQITARPFGEAMVLRVGAAYQADSDWHLKRPPLAW